MVLNLFFSVLHRLVGWRAAINGEAEFPGDPLLPEPHRLQGWPGPGLWESQSVWGRLGRNSSPSALAVICTILPLLHGLAALRLPGRSARQGPPSGGGDSCRSLRVMVFRARRLAGWPYKPPGWSHPSRLEIHSLREVGEYIGRRARPEHFRDRLEAVTPPDRMKRSSMDKYHWGGRRLLPGRPPPPLPTSKYYQQHSRTERALRRRGARSGRVRGSQPGIGWIPSEAGVQWRFTAAHCVGHPWHQEEPERQRGKGRAQAFWNGQWGRVREFLLEVNR